MSLAGETNLWSAFPLVMCINLKEREDRYLEARQEFARVGLKRVTYYRTARQQDGIKGCFDSHMACLRYAVEQGVPYVLIFEDDVLFLEGYAESMRRVVRFLEARPDCNLLYLGGYVLRKAGRAGPHFLRGAILTNHAYVVRTEFARRLLAERPPVASGVALDHYYVVLNGNKSFVHVDPLVCIQRASPSDTGWHFRDWDKTGWWGKAMIYTSLSYAGRLRYKEFTLHERLQLETGLPIIRLCLHYARLKVHRARKADQSGRSPNDDIPPGEFVPAEAAPALPAVCPA